jgi:hypothetical protein
LPKHCTARADCYEAGKLCDPQKSHDVTSCGAYNFRPHPSPGHGTWRRPRATLSQQARLGWLTSAIGLSHCSISVGGGLWVRCLDAAVRASRLSTLCARVVLVVTPRAGAAAHGLPAQTARTDRCKCCRNRRGAKSLKLLRWLASIEARLPSRTNDGITVRLEHRASGSRFAFRRDDTWCFLGYCSVADGLERIFDRSWMGVIPLVSSHSCQPG